MSRFREIFVLCTQKLAGTLPSLWSSTWASPQSVAPSVTAPCHPGPRPRAPQYCRGAPQSCGAAASPRPLCPDSPGPASTCLGDKDTGPPFSQGNRFCVEKARRGTGSSGAGGQRRGAPQRPQPQHGHPAPVASFPLEPVAKAEGGWEPGGEAKACLCSQHRPPPCPPIRGDKHTQNTQPCGSLGVGRKPQ